MSDFLRHRRFRFLPAVVLLLLAGLAVVTFTRLGRFMASDDPLEKADAIFVFAGTRIERPLEAVDLYREGYAPRIVVTRAAAEQAVLTLERRGVHMPTDFDLTRDALLKLGVPPGVLIQPIRVHDNTAAEAQTLRDLIVRNKWRRVILVSSKYHMRRIGLAVRREMRGVDAQLILRGSRHDASTPDRWWQRRSDIRWLLSEIPKLIAYEVGVGA